MRFSRQPSLKSASGLVWSAIVLSYFVGRFAPYLALRTLLAMLIVCLPLVCPVVAVAYVKYSAVIAGQPAEFVPAFLYYVKHLDPVDEILAAAFIFVTSVTLGANFILALSYSRDLVIRFLEPLNLSIGEFASQLSSQDAIMLNRWRSTIDDWWQRFA